MKRSTLLKWIWIWPPFLGAGISVKSFSPDLLNLEVQMKLKFWNSNYFRTQFGGSLFSMTDPFYALMLIEHLGKDYMIWDKSSAIEFKSPGRGTVFAKFILTQTEIEKIRKQADTENKAEPQFKVEIRDKENNLVAIVNKTISVKHKDKINMKKKS